jgi:hypothetical protein
VSAQLKNRGRFGQLFHRTPTRHRSFYPYVAASDLAGQVLLHLPEDTLLTLTFPPDVKSIDKLKPGDHVAVRNYDATVLHLAKTNAAATEKPAPRLSAKKVRSKA